MTNAAKKSAAKPAAKKAAAPKTPAEVSTDSPEFTPPTPPPADSVAEELRTANLIAVLALGPDAWRDLYAAGAGDDASETVAVAVVERLGLSS